MEARICRIPSCRTRRSWISRAGAAGPATPTGGPLVTSFTLNVALILDRANDPSALLDANWAIAPATTRDPERQRHAVVDLRRRHGELQPGAGRARRAWASRRSTQVRRAGRAERLRLVGRIAHDLGAGRPRPISQRCSARGFAAARRRQNWLLGGQPVAAPSGWPDARRQGPVVRHGELQRRCCPIPATARRCPCRRAGRAPATPATSPTNIFPQQIADTTTTSRSGDLWNPPRASRRDRHDRPGRAGRRHGRAGGQARSARCSNAYRAPARHRHAGQRDLRRAAAARPYPTIVRRRPSIPPASARSMSASSRRSIRRASSSSMPARATAAGASTRNAFTAYQSAFWDLVQQSAGHHLVVRLHAADRAGLAVLFRRAASSSSMPRCATSRCSTTPATAARATSTATA